MVKRGQKAWESGQRDHMVARECGKGPNLGHKAPTKDAPKKNPPFPKNMGFGLNNKACPMLFYQK